MKTVIQISLWLIFMFLFSACKTSSRLKSNTETNRKTEVQLVKHAILKDTTAELLTTNKNVTLEITEETTMYDTSKPNVIGTNHPPELKRTIRHIKTADNSTINKQVNSNNQTTSDSQLKEQTKESIKEKITENRKSKAMFSFPWWIYPAAIVLILAALYFYCPPIRIIINKFFSHKQI